MISCLLSMRVIETKHLSLKTFGDLEYHMFRTNQLYFIVGYNYEFSPILYAK